MSRCADLGFRVQAGPLSTLEQYFHVLSGDEDEGEDTVADTLPGLGGAAAAVPDKPVKRRFSIALTKGALDGHAGLQPGDYFPAVLPGGC